MAKATNKEASTEGDSSKKVRTSMYIDPKLLEKVQYISFMDEGYDSQTDFITEALEEKVKAWEKKNGEAVKK